MTVSYSILINHMIYKQANLKLLQEECIVALKRIFHTNILHIWFKAVFDLKRQSKVIKSLVNPWEMLQKIEI